MFIKSFILSFIFVKEEHVGHWNRTVILETSVYWINLVLWSR